MKHQNKKGFTLIELVIVVVIIGIISTIGVISFSSYLVKSRDSKRSIDIVSISAALDIQAKKQSGLYQIPSESIILTYNSGSDNVPFSYLGKVTKDLNLDFNVIPVDPLSGDNYVYGLTKNKKYYQLGGTVELDTNITYNPLVSQTYAASDYGSEYAYIYGNYKQNIEIGNYLSGLIVLENNVGENTIPKKDTSVGSLINSEIVLTGSILIIEHLSTDVPYHLTSTKPSLPVQDSDFYISAEGTDIVCPNCSN